MKALLVLPILIPLLTAALAVSRLGQPRAQRWLSVGGSLALLAAALGLLGAAWRDGVLAVQIGDWAAPFGITLAADLLSATLVLLAATMGLCVALYALADIDAPRLRLGFTPLHQALLAGVCGAFLTGDLFNLYVWFEVLLTASFVLLTLGGQRAQLEGALKYVTLNLLGSALFLAGAGLLYGAAGTLNFADLAVRMPALSSANPALMRAISALFLVAFALKAAVFPLGFWLPASYAVPPAAVSALFAALLTKVGVYALTRVFTLVFPLDEQGGALLLALALASMLVGVLGAVAQVEFRRILAFHSVSQIGYMVMGLGLLASPEPGVRALGLAASLTYVLHHGLVKGNLFLISGAAHALGGTYELKALGGLARRAPWLAGLFLVAALSLAGLPPSSGFWAKFAMIKAGLDAGQYVLAAGALLTGLLTLLSMAKIWNEAFWKAHADPPRIAPAPPRQGWRLAPIAALVVLTAAIGLAPGPLFALARRAATQALDRDAYVAAVGLQSQVRPAPGAAAPAAPEPPTGREVER